MKNDSRIWIAVIFIAVGFIFLLDQLGLLNPLGLSAGWFFAIMWPSIIFGLGVYLLLRKSYIFGIIFTLIGFGLIVSVITDWSLWGIFWPLIIIGIGLTILFRPKSEGHSKENVSKPTGSGKDDMTGVYTETIDNIDELVIFSGKDTHIDSKNFTGGKATSIFGGMKLDLRDIDIAKNGATLDVVSVFGSLKIYVPKKLRVETSGTPILGSWENKFKSESMAKTKILKISGAAIFGSVEVIN